MREVFWNSLPNQNQSEQNGNWHTASRGTPESPLTQVIEMLLDKDYTAVPVIDHDGKVVGMVSDNDLLTRGGMKVTISLKKTTDLDYVRGLHDSLENPHHKVSEVMTRQVVTITPDAILARAAR